jgi:rhamnose utilization protein RhaD (predicted bifunctional aldolase and dehydrogenase)
MNDKTSLSELIAMTHELGNPKYDYAIQAEGNTSARIDDDCFWVKASGYMMSNIDASGFVAMRFKPMLDLLDGPAMTEAELKEAFKGARVDPASTLRPSIEVALHALMLTIGGAKFVGHTHPTAWNAILCAKNAEQAVKGRVFPDHVVVCGPAPMYIKYTDPGIPLAQETRRQLRAYIEAYGMPPKEVLMQNHGLIALGQSATEVERITAMSVKSARIQLATYALGGPNYLSDEDVSHLWTRPDEVARRNRLTSTQ